MIKVNDNFMHLSPSYLFSEIARKVSEFQKTHPEADIIRMGIGDVTRPICRAAIEGLRRGADDESHAETFHGYGPEQGQEFLRKAIAGHDYADTNVMAGRAGRQQPDGCWSNIEYLPCTAENSFVPPLPLTDPDVIYLCYPNNPTGTTLTRSQLKLWVDYALEHGSLILFDSAYEAYITSDDVPHSIYEIEGARRCAIEFRSFSKTAGSTGLRLGYTVVPSTLCGVDSEGNSVSLRQLWLRRQTTKFNGASYVVQRAAEAIYTPEGQRQVAETIAYYHRNAAMLREGLASQGLEVYGGTDAPYIWVRTPEGMSSWDFFYLLLERCHVVCTPGVGFGPSGEGYCRFTAFSSAEATEQAVERIKHLSLK